MRRDRACRHTRYSLSCVTLAIIIISSYALGALGALIVQCREHGCDRTIPDRPANKQIRIVPRDLLDQHGELGVEGGRPPQRIDPSLEPPLPSSGELGFEVEAPMLRHTDLHRVMLPVAEVIVDLVIKGTHDHDFGERAQQAATASELRPGPARLASEADAHQPVGPSAVGRSHRVSHVLSRSSPEVPPRLQSRKHRLGSEHLVAQICHRWALGPAGVLASK